MPRRERTLYTQITIDVKTFDELWQLRNRFEGSGERRFQGRISWSSFLKQGALYLALHHSLLPIVSTKRCNVYVDEAKCPKCGTREYPLKRRRHQVIWLIECFGCGNEYIAVRKEMMNG